jgi:hypothetical protein
MPNPRKIAVDYPSHAQVTMQSLPHKAKHDTDHTDDTDRTNDSGTSVTPKGSVKISKNLLKFLSVKSLGSV